MKKTTIIALGLAASFCIGFSIKPRKEKHPVQNIATNQPHDMTMTEKSDKLTLGAFSISLSVKDLKVSREFYENIGFTAFGGSMEQHYLIMKNGNALIGLFQGMFKNNILTFNPGWDENASAMANYNDIREIQKHVKGKGVKLDMEADESTSGPASFMVTDPDGNAILFDQHL